MLNDYESKRKQIDDEMNFIYQDNDRLLNMGFEKNSGAKQRAKDRVKQNELDISSLQAELDRVEESKERLLQKIG